MSETTTTPLDQIRHLHPCSEAAEWLETQIDPAQAWATCERGDWMLWLLGKLSGPPESDSRKRLVLAACDCAELALSVFAAHYPEDNRPRAAIETARRYARGEATLEQVRTAADAASAAYAAASAAYAAAYAAYAAYAAADAKTLKQCADIVRSHYPEPPTITIGDAE